MSHKDLELAKKYTKKAASAKSRGIEFTLSFTEYKRLISRKTCQYSGVVFDKRINVSNSRTLERIDASIGYTKENTVAVTSRVNSIKNTMIDDKNVTMTKSEITKFMKILINQSK